MRDLKTHRQGWDEIEREERRLAGSLTIAQSVRILLSLCETMAPLMIQTEELFRREREAYLIEFQARLLRLNAWRDEYGTTGEPLYERSHPRINSSPGMGNGVPPSHTAA